MTFGQIPNGAIAFRQMPFLSLVGYTDSETPVEPPIDPPPAPETEDSGGSVTFSRDDYLEELEEIEEGKPPWKERSYRELKEVLEILTIVGFFE